jgi:hypothetical protein
MEKLSKFRLNGLFTRKTELTNKVDKINMGFRKLVDLFNETNVSGIEAVKAMWNIFMFSTATF